MVQLYAHDLDGHRIFVECAQKGHDYLCHECGRLVRLRGGLYRQLHFYHMDDGGACRLHEKTIEHVMTQRLLQSAIADTELEVRFCEIGRVADAVCWSKKLVFEVQVSPIRQEEVASRIQDYKRAGFDTIFILHTKNFMKRLATPAEDFLLGCTHYFTDVGEEGGSFFDSLSWIVRKRRLFLQRQSYARLQIDIATIAPYENAPTEPALAIIEQRRLTWKWSAEGDLLSMKSLDKQLLHEARLIEESALDATSLQRSLAKKWTQFFTNLFYKIVERWC